MVMTDVRRISRFWSMIASLSLVLLVWLAPGRGMAQDAGALLTPAPQTYHPWQVPPPQGTAQAYFVNLANDDKIETPFLVRFGLAGGWGLAPIAAPTGGKSGHHHLLVNRELPLDFKKPLPFNEQYIHFGKGQMETVLNLAPGKYSLRLLLADDKHLPHFVYSKPVTVTVLKKNPVDPATLMKKGISVTLADSTVKGPFRVQFHASGLNVGHAVQKQKDTGHFRLTVSPSKGTDAVLDFVNGQTEVWLLPPAGEYTFRLEFLDNANPGRPLVDVVTTSARVQQ